MTSNRSFFKLQRELIRRNLILPVLSGVGFFFALPLFTLMMIQHELDMLSSSTYTALEREKIINEFVLNNLLSVRYDGAKLGIIIMASLAGFMLFKYLHSNKQVDFFHSLPISRGNLFIELYLTGFISVIPFYIVMYLISVIFAYAMGAGSLLTAGVIIKAIVVNVLFFLLFYSLAIFATILSGNTFISILIYAFLNFVIIITTTIISVLFDYWFKTYTCIPILDNIGSYSCPLYLYFCGGNLFNQNGKPISTKALVFMTIVIIAFIALSYILFKIRKSERAGSALAFYKTKAPLKCYLVLVSGYLLMFIFNNIAGEPWRYLGIILGVILSHMVLEGLYNFDMRSLFKNWKTMVALLIVSVGFFTIMKTDIIGYDSKIPNLDDISGVSIETYYTNSNGYSSGVATFEPMTTSENIDSVYAMAQYAIENLDNIDYDKYYGYDFYSESENIKSFSIRYILKNGSEIFRNYLVPAGDEFDSHLEDIILTDDYRKHEVGSVFNLHLDMISQLSININQSLSYDGVSGVIKNTDKSIEIAKAIMEDSLTLTKEQAETTAPLFNISFDVIYDNSKASGYIGYGDYLNSVAIYPTYTKTLALISQYYDITPQVINADDIERIDITKYNDNTELNEISERYYTVSVSDKETIAKLIENSISGNIVSCSNPLFEFDTIPSIEVNIIFNSQDSTFIYYRKGTAPLDLINELLEKQ